MREIYNPQDIFYDKIYLDLENTIIDHFSNWKFLDKK